MGPKFSQAGYRTPGQMMPGTYFLAQRVFLMDTVNKAPLIEKMWLLAQMHGTAAIIRWGVEIPVVPLSGLPVEYQVMQRFSRDRGRRKSDLALSTFPATSSGRGGFAAREFNFDCLPTQEVQLAIQDDDGRGCVSSLLIRDNLGRLVGDPNPNARLDFSDKALKGVPQETRTLRITLLKSMPTDLTIAFRVRHDVPNPGGRDRVHFVLRCQ